MVLFPHCKINIGLFITERRPDGYHNLETIFYPVRTMYDVLEAVPAKKSPSLTVSGNAISGDVESNLVWKAYQLLRKRFPSHIPKLDIYLHKVLPMGAGLGGGSADGAFMLRLLNKAYELQLGEADLLELALQLGSDCPFFIKDDAQFATGRGEVLEPIDLDLSSYDIRVECPGIHVSTAEAFSMLTPKTAPFDLRTLPGIPVAEWKERIGNDFEEPVFRQHPSLRALKEKLYEEGALYAQMSGSGSAVFGIFPKQTLAQ